MKRLIDADALSEKLCETTIFIKDGEVFQRMINDAPTVDAVEVVRCKDCKHWGESFKGCKRNPCVEAWHRHDFCSYGERREL